MNNDDMERVTSFVAVFLSSGLKMIDGRLKIIGIRENSAMILIISQANPILRDQIMI